MPLPSLTLPVRFQRKPCLALVALALLACTTLPASRASDLRNTPIVRAVRHARGCVLEPAQTGGGYRLYDRNVRRLVLVAGLWPGLPRESVAASAGELNQSDGRLALVLPKWAPGDGFADEPRAAAKGKP